MNRTPVADWQQLSALYELADTLDPDSLGDWLAQLREQAHPLLTQLEQMLAARSQIQRNGFLGALPRLPAPPAPRVIAWQAGSRIGPYRLLRKIGSGGMAEVWLAQRDDGAFQRQVAIKLLFRHAGSDALDTFAQRFDRERDILASLDHPHIAGLHDAGVTPNGQPWLALEYVEGQTLTSWCDARYLTIEARVRLFRQVLLAVQHAHANLVIHRDLKPGNVLVTANGEVRLLDFGIAKLIEPEGGALAETELTRLAGRPMTPQYAAPEQLMGQPLTTACDVYSLGVVLYELLCGERPYELKMESTAQLEQAILDTEPRAPSRRALAEPTATARGTTGPVLRKQLASDLDAIVLRALAKQPTQRYGSVEAMRADLDRWLGGEPVEARAPSTVYRIGKFVRRHMLSVSLGAGAVVALAGVAGAAVVMGLQARQESARAVAARDFMMGMFKQADADKSRGADVTARELLDRGRDDVLRRLTRQPELQIDLLQGIAAIQAEMQEFDKADASFESLARLQRSQNRSSAAALTIAARADNALRMDRDAMAGKLVEEAAALTMNERRDVELDARLELTRGWLALRKGGLAAAKERFLSSLKSATRDAKSLTNVRAEALSGLIKLEAASGKFEEALGAQHELEQTMLRIEGFGPRDAAALDIGRGELLATAGRFREASTHDHAALARCSATLGPHDARCRRLLFDKASALLALGWADRVRPDLPSLREMLDDPSSSGAQAATLTLLYRIYSALGELPQQPALASRQLSIVDAGDAVGVKASRKVSAHLAIAEDQLRAGRGPGAQATLARVVSDDGIDLRRQPDAPFETRAQSMMGFALLLQQRPAQALVWFQQARSHGNSSLGAGHTAVLLISVNEAIALCELDRTEEAMRLMKTAEQGLRSTMGEEAPTYQRVLRLQREMLGLSTAGPGQAATARGLLPSRSLKLAGFFG